MGRCRAVAPYVAHIDFTLGVDCKYQKLNQTLKKTNNIHSQPHSY